MCSRTFGFVSFGNYVFGTIYRVPGVRFGDRISGSEVLSGSVRASNSRSESFIFSLVVKPVQVCVCIKVCISVVGSFTVSVSKLVLSLDVFSRLSVFRVSSI